MAQFSIRLQRTPNTYGMHSLNIHVPRNTLNSFLISSIPAHIHHLGPVHLRRPCRPRGRACLGPFHRILLLLMDLRLLRSTSRTNQSNIKVARLGQKWNGKSSLTWQNAAEEEIPTPISTGTTLLLALADVVVGMCPVFVSHSGQLKLGLKLGFHLRKAGHSDRGRQTRPQGFNSRSQDHRKTCSFRRGGRLMHEFWSLSSTPTRSSLVPWVYVSSFDTTSLLNTRYYVYHGWHELTVLVMYGEFDRFTNIWCSTMNVPVFFFPPGVRLASISLATARLLSEI